MNILINVAAFKIAWLATIFGSANGLPMLGPMAVLIAVIIHLWRADIAVQELRLLIVVGLIGLFWDSVMLSTGLLVYPNGIFISGVAPYWMFSLWVLFATTLNVSLRWLRSRLGLAALMGAVFGPMSYMAGASVGAVKINDPTTVYAILSLSWLFLLPLVAHLSKQMDGMQTAAEKSVP